MKNERLFGTFLVFGSTVAFSLLASITALAMRTGLCGETILVWEFGIAAVLTLIYMSFSKISLMIPRESILLLIIVASTYFAQMATYYCALSQISGSLATIISFTYPTIVVCVEVIRGKEKISILKVVSILMAFIGLIIIVWAPGLKANFIGILFAIITACIYPIYVIGLDEKKICDLHPVTVSAYVFIICTLGNLIRCMILDKPVLEIAGSQIIYLIILGVVCTFVPIILFCKGVRFIGPANSAIINMFEPALACVFCYFIAGDNFTLGMFIGGVMIIGAIFISYMSPKPDKKL